MLSREAMNTNDGRVDGIAIGNQLGPGIVAASLPEPGPGGSWSTCMMGCNTEPPRDVAHLQFRSAPHTGSGWRRTKHTVA